MEGFNPLSLGDILAQDTAARADALARDMLEQARATLLLHLRYMGIAIGRLDLQPKDDTPLATDGLSLYYHAGHVFDVYREEPAALSRDVLHSVLHCVFSHPFVGPGVDREKWDLACDIAVENAITGLDLPRLATARQGRQAGPLDTLPKGLHPLTAERIYRWLMNNPEVVTLDLRIAFWADDHGLWYENPATRAGQGQGEGSGRARRAREKLAREWKETGHRVQMDAEASSHRREGGAGTLVQNLREVTRERYDYAAFLRRFAALEEEMHLSDDEFDYVFYTYGLRLYENMPLIEPLEYREALRVREFVVAIDTSGSVSGDQVQQFVQKTYNILMESESFSSRVSLRIIQCDAEIREDVQITGREDFERYLATMELKGFGGTDFRPVFEHVDSLRRQGQLRDLRGLIYFTDGHGIFPQHMPRYETAFVFVEDDPESAPHVPVWAIKLVLGPHELSS